MQLVGTEAMRNTFGGSIWVRSAFENLDPGVVSVFQDVRFPDEADAIRRSGGLVFLVCADLADPWDTKGDPNALASRHASETALVNYAGFDGIVRNPRTLDGFSSVISEQVIPRVISM